jgi:imidazole glycerol phosphate synthase glutamine amidotransferase subunit
MGSLASRGLVEGLRTALEGGRQFLGICVGLQVLFEGSEESPSVPGMGILAGRVERFRFGKIPQIGWNLVRLKKGSGYPSGYAYFVNSFVAVPKDPEDILFESDYFDRFCAGVQRGNLTAFQFHPEKSGPFGFALLRRWLDAV